MIDMTLVNYDLLIAAMLLTGAFIVNLIIWFMAWFK